MLKPVLPSTIALAPALALAMFLVSCGRADHDALAEPRASASTDPVEHVENLIRLIARGEVANAWVTFLPPSWERDVEQVFSRAKALLTKEEFERSRAIVAKLGEKLEPVFTELAASSDPDTSAALAHLRDLPKTLGCDSWAAFERLTVRELVARLESGFLRSALANDELRARLASTTVRLDSSTSNRSRLEVSSQAADGERTTTTLELELVDGRWVPEEIARDWSSDVRETLAAIDEFAATKRENPRVILAQLEELDGQLDGLAAMVGGFARMAQMQAGLGN